jgi:hypothetical protein
VEASSRILCFPDLAYVLASGCAGWSGSKLHIRSQHCRTAAVIHASSKPCKWNQRSRLWNWWPHFLTHNRCNDRKLLVSNDPSVSLAFLTGIANTLAATFILNRNAIIRPPQLAFDAKLLHRFDVLLLLSWAFISTLGYITHLFSPSDYAISIRRRLRRLRPF